MERAQLIEALKQEWVDAKARAKQSLESATEAQEKYRYYHAEWNAHESTVSKLAALLAYLCPGWSE